MWFPTKAMYIPTVAKDAWAKFGTRVVMYVRVRPMDKKARSDARIIASEYIGSIAMYDHPGSLKTPRANGCPVRTV